jgi:hypothetical protein
MSGRGDEYREGSDGRGNLRRERGGADDRDRGAASAIVDANVDRETAERTASPSVGHGNARTKTGNEGGGTRRRSRGRSVAMGVAYHRGRPDNVRRDGAVAFPALL